MGFRWVALDAEAEQEGFFYREKNSLGGSDMPGILVVFG